jgi:hypothetical protein
MITLRLVTDIKMTIKVVYRGGVQGMIKARKIHLTTDSTKRYPRNSIPLSEKFCAPRVLRYLTVNFHLICIIEFSKKMAFFYFKQKKDTNFDTIYWSC